MSDTNALNTTPIHSFDSEADPLHVDSMDIETPVVEELPVGNGLVVTGPVGNGPDCLLSQATLEEALSIETPSVDTLAEASNSTLDQTSENQNSENQVTENQVTESELLEMETLAENELSEETYTDLSAKMNIASMSSVALQIPKAKRARPRVRTPLIPPALDPFDQDANSTVSTFDDLHWSRTRYGVLATSYICLRAKHAPAAAHSLRVSFWAAAWGLKNDCSEEEIVLLETLGLLHEIGKIGVPDRLLQKAGQLYEHEFAMLEKHWEIGYEILSAINVKPSLLAAFKHLSPELSQTPFPEENLEGSSIDAKRSEKFAQLVRIIDLYDTKLYHSEEFSSKVSPREIALAEVISRSGTEFDPPLAKSFVELVLTIDDRLKHKISERWIGALEPRDLLSEINLDSLRRLHGFGSSAVKSLRETFYRRMIDHIENGVIFIDSEYRILNWNGAAERLTGRSAKQVLHQTWSPVMAGLCDAEGYPLNDIQCPFRDLINNNFSGRQSLAIRTPNDECTQITIDVVPVYDDRGLLCGGVMIIEDESQTTELQQTIEHLSQKVCIDPLTNLSNKGELNRHLPEFLEFHQRSREPASVIICDIDYFKKINDTYSHQAGDDALVVFADLLKEGCRESDFIARFGGEEFVILCGHCTLAEAKQLSETLRVKLQRTPIPSLRNHCLTASFGVATVQPEDTAESVLGRADRGLMIAKESGRDRVVALGDDDGESTNKPSKAKKTFLSWLIAPTTKPLSAELITNVPRAVTLEKLKGFVHEFQAVVQHVDSNKLVLDIDCKTAPIAKRRAERLSKFRMTLGVSDVEMRVSNSNTSIKVCTLLNVDVVPLKTRDRRTEAIRSQAVRLKTALQVYLVAHEMDSDIEKDIIRRFNAPAEAARY